MKDRKNETLTEIWLRKLKNNRIVAALILLSIAIAGISAFTDSATKLYYFVFPPAKHGGVPDAISTYTVEISGVPTIANRGAHTQPHSVRLDLYSEKDIQSIVTMNYPISKLFVWSPKISNKVVLTISVGTLELKKEYPGRLGFPEFLREFHTGNRVFRANEFSDDQVSILKKYGVEFITVAFNIRGAQPIEQYMFQ